MASFTQAISDFISSIFNFIASIFQTAWRAVESVFALFAGLLKQVFDLFEGLVGFVMGNFFIIGLIGVGIGVYFMLLHQKGEKVVVQKKKA